MTTQSASDVAATSAIRRHPESKKSWRSFARRILGRCGRAFIEWFAHSVLLFGIFACIEALRHGLILLGIPENKLFFGRVPLMWLIDGADLALLVGIGVVGIIAAVRSYLGRWD